MGVIQNPQANREALQRMKEERRYLMELVAHGKVASGRSVEETLTMPDNASVSYGKYLGQYSSIMGGGKNDTATIQKARTDAYYARNYIQNNRESYDAERGPGASQTMMDYIDRSLGEMGDFEGRRLNKEIAAQREKSARLYELGKQDKEASQKSILPTLKAPYRGPARKLIDPETMDMAVHKIMGEKDDTISPETATTPAQKVGQLNKVDYALENWQYLARRHHPDARYSLLTDDEVNEYRSLLEGQGEAVADKYLRTLEGELNARQEQERTGFGKTVNNIAEGIAEIPEYLFSGAYDMTIGTMTGVPYGIVKERTEGNPGLGFWETVGRAVPYVGGMFNNFGLSTMRGVADWTNDVAGIFGGKLFDQNPWDKLVEGNRQAMERLSAPVREKGTAFENILFDTGTSAGFSSVLSYIGGALGTYTQTGMGGGTYGVNSLARAGQIEQATRYAQIAPYTLSSMNDAYAQAEELGLSPVETIIFTLTAGGMSLATNSQAMDKILDKISFTSVDSAALYGKLVGHGFANYGDNAIRFFSGMLEQGVQEGLQEMIESLSMKLNSDMWTGEFFNTEGWAQWWETEGKTEGGMGFLQGMLFYFNALPSYVQSRGMMESMINGETEITPDAIADVIQQMDAELTDPVILGGMKANAQGLLEEAESEMASENQQEADVGGQFAGVGPGVIQRIIQGEKLKLQRLHAAADNAAGIAATVSEGIAAEQQAQTDMTGASPVTQEAPLEADSVSPEVKTDQGVPFDQAATIDQTTPADQAQALEDTAKTLDEKSATGYKTNYTESNSHMPVREYYQGYMEVYQAAKKGMSYESSAAQATYPISTAARMAAYNAGQRGAVKSSQGSAGEWHTSGLDAGFRADQHTAAEETGIRGEFDGVSFRDIRDGSEEIQSVYAAFAPEPIKSIHNRQPTDNPDIRYSGKDFVLEDDFGDRLLRAAAGKAADMDAERQGAGARAGVGGEARGEAGSAALTSEMEQAGVQNLETPSNSDIINHPSDHFNADKQDVGSVYKNGAFRKSKAGSGIEPMPAEQLERIRSAFFRRGGDIVMDSDGDKYLTSRGAQGITYNEKTIILSRSPSRATVFEELIHATQYKKGKIDGTGVSRVKCEIEAKEKLLRNAKAYRLTDAEIAETKILLERDRTDLEELLRR